MIRARKRFGQHFLEPVWVNKVIAAIDPRPDQRFIEIGPGRGALTRPLVDRASHVIAVEIDQDLALELLRLPDSRGEPASNLTVVGGDFLDPSVLVRVSDLVGMASAPLRVVGNLPYNVASPILFELVKRFASGMPLIDATVMLQREVADRLLAPPGTKAYGAMTILIGHHAKVDRLLNLPPGAFRPVPKVSSTVVRLSFHPPDPPVGEPVGFRHLVETAFSHRRKTIANAIGRLRAPHPVTLPSWLDARRRPETLSIAEFVRLCDDLHR
jgi:16S rRNA (adenine1518-N6/adenine1519-N6)-dimethyltransferase